MDTTVSGSVAALMPRIAEFATLAPSSHNSQPWRFKVHPDRLEVFIDPQRRLPVVDPQDRALVISCSAALEAAAIAMRALDLDPQVSLGGDGVEAPLASIEARPAPATNFDATFDLTALGQRHTNRGRFEPQAISEETIARLRTRLGERVWMHAVSDRDEKQALAQLIAEGDHIQQGDPEFRGELAAWVRHNHDTSGDGIPGYAHGMTGVVGDVLSVGTGWALRTFDMGDGVAARDQKLAEGSPLLLVLGTTGDERADWVETGRALMRLLVGAERLGIRASFLNQPIEVPELRPRLARLIGREGQYPQLLLRLGYARRSRPTPRRPLHQVLVK